MVDEYNWVDEAAHACVPGRSSAGWDHLTTSAGYVARGKFADPATGYVYLADNDGRLAAPGWVVSSAYGDGLQRYWVDEAAHACVPGRSSDGWDHWTTSAGYVARGALRDGADKLWADNDGRLAGTGWLVTDAFGDGLQRYWMDGGAAARSRLVSESEAGWWAYATPYGYVARGKFADPATGYVYLADNDGRLAAPGWVVSSAYGDGLQRYWVDAATRSAVTGFFEVDGCRFYAPDGYVVRGKGTYAGYVVLSDNEGVLCSAPGWLVTTFYDGGVIERYWIAEIEGQKGFYGALVGFFDVDGSSYHGVSAQGYVLRNGCIWHGRIYCYANNDGVLSEYDCYYSRMVNAYLDWAVSIAYDDSHGYDQQYRWGERGDYDCSSLVVSSLRVVGFNTGWATYTGNMRSSLTNYGFVWCTDFSLLKRGDILLNEVYHTAMYLGDGNIVQASGNEFEGAIGGVPGDQTGTEICVRTYYDYPWDGFLRMVEGF